MKEQYSAGLDFGTASVRAVIVSNENGRVAAEAERGYQILEGDLADSKEYLAAMTECLKEAVEKSGKAGQIKTLSVDATSLTLVAADADGNAVDGSYIRLWKRHTAQKQQERLQRVAEERGEAFLRWCGYHISSEWAFPKMLEVYETEPELYHKTRYFLDLCDWITSLLCGQIVRSRNAMVFKFHYDGQLYPSEEYLREATDYDFAETILEKLEGPILNWGERAGTLTKYWAEKMGLSENVIITAGSLDGHVSMAALGLVKSGDTMITLGTSGVCAVISDPLIPVPGISGAGMDTMIPGYAGYDSGQSAVGDIFAWYVDNCLPFKTYMEAQKLGISPHTYLSQKAFAEKTTEDMPIAIDWWNGCRCPKGDLTLKGAVLGMTLSTKPEEIYRALVESTAFGLKAILDNYEAHGVKIKQLRACGGIAVKNPELMQCYANVLNRRIECTKEKNTAAVGAAILSAAAVYPSLTEAVAKMSFKDFTVYEPNPEEASVHAKRYVRYCKCAGFINDMNT